MGAGSNFIQTSSALRRIAEQASQFAQVDVPVLCLGESGTGKEVIAKLIHSLSPRANNMFLKVNCAALPADLLESELFGYEAGAFTGATRSKPGKFELCHGGTLMLDEVGEMPTSLQAKLLHVLQDGEFMRLGGRHQLKVDVRILAATNVDVQQALRTKTLREDLYYRLSAFIIRMPPLRERREDIVPILRYYINLYAETYKLPQVLLSENFISACLRYHWPGNVRELENLAKRVVILRDESLVLSELRLEPAGNRELQLVDAANDRPDDLKSLVRGLKADAEIDAIRQALDETRWNRKEAAKLLKISYKAMLYKVRQYGLDHPQAAPAATSGSMLRRAATC
ncbi:MAG TPA: sigma 54-interacting transcriptional regulator [Bryobacteraceae bacterium]|jgi:transcriptional regulator with PAS, ATPase and Fis domain|nr:sigma 54-interacting transcriptional regulator [Bryobacteraceae bacterium]